MKVALKVAVAAAVAFVASPASAADWRYCITTVKDSSGQDRILLISDIYDMTGTPGYASEWEALTKSAAVNALRQHGENGTAKSICARPQGLSDQRIHRGHILRIAGVKGMLIEEVDWRPGQSSSRSADGSGSGASGDEDVASADDSSSSSDSSSDESSKMAEKPEEERIRRIGADLGSPPAGYSDWEQQYRGDYVDVHYAYKASDDEVRVVWRCVNHSNKDMSCSIGAGGDKEYQCWKGNTTLGSTRMPGERATVRAGRTYTFPSDWACRGKGATSVAAITRISIEAD